jgi:hypothetical protein
MRRSTFRIENMTDTSQASWAMVKATPSSVDVHVNRPLTNISIAYMQDATGFVADRVFPNLPVMKQSDRYFRYDRSDFWRNQYEVVAPSAETAGSGYKLDNTPTYFADEWGLHKDVADSIRANADVPLDMDRDATLWLTQQALISREVQWAKNYFIPGLWTGINGVAGTDITGVASAPGANQVLTWDGANSTPVQDVKANSDLIQLRTGMRPKTLVVGRQVWTKLSDHPELVDRIKYGTSSPTNPAIVSKQATAALMELDDLMVAEGIQVTSPENPSFEASMTTAFIAGKNALLAYVAPAPTILVPSAGYTFSWTGRAGTGPQGQRIKTIRLEWKETDRIEGKMAYAQKAVATDCAIFFSGIVP